MRPAFSTRWAALGLVIATWLCLAILLPAQDMFGTTGAPMGGLEPWDEPANPSPRDLGIEHRVHEMLRHHVERLREANAAVRDAAGQGWNVAAEAAMMRQQSVCEDILAVIGVIKRHNAEIQKWQLGASQTRYILGPDLFTSAFDTGSLDDGAVGGKVASGAAPQGEQLANGWPHLASLWLPYEAAVAFSEEERRIVARLGLSPAVWEADRELALCALLILLRQVGLDESGSLTLRENLRAFVEATSSQYIEKYEMGKLRTDPQETAVALESCLGRKDVGRLLDVSCQEACSLALGSYTYSVVRQSQTVKYAESASTPVAKAFLRKMVCANQSSDVAKSYAEKAQLFTSLASELRTRVTSAPEGAPVQRDATLYAPFLWALAHCVPCLSPFRADAQAGGSVRFTQGWAAADQDGSTDLWRVEEELNRLLASKGGKAPNDLFLLQADFEPDASNSWRWSPRAAGFRGFLNEREKATPASGGK